MSELPPGWARTDLQTVAEWGSGGTPKAGTAAYYGGEIPWAVIGDLTDGVVSATQSTITQLGLSSSSAKVVGPDCVLIAMYGSIGKLGLPTIPLATNQAIAFARPHKEILSRKYLFFYLLSQRSRLSGAGKGATQQNVSQTILRSWPLPLPPVAEQYRIVAAIEEQFSRLDAATAALDRVALDLKRMRASILRSTYEVAAGEFGTAPLSKVLGKEALFVDGDWVESKDQDPGGDHRLTQLADIGDGAWRNRSSRFMNAEQFTRLGCKALRTGDVLVARMPDPLGRACIFPGDAMPCATVVDVAIIRPGDDSVNPEWLMWMLNSPQVRSQVAALAKGTTRRRISRTNLGTIGIPKSDLTAQLAQLEALESRLDAASRMEEAIRVARLRNATLSSAILTAAFSGRLVAQNSSDEPASALLERIVGERASSNGNNARRGPKQSDTNRKVLA